MTIKKRHVFYVPGYEPSGPPLYEHFFIKHLNRYSELNDLSIKSVHSSDIDHARRQVCEFESSESCSKLTYDILSHEDLLQSYIKMPRWKCYLLLVSFTPSAIRAACKPDCTNIAYGSMLLFSPWLFFYLALVLISFCFIIFTSFLTSIELSNAVSTTLSSLLCGLLFYLFDRQHQKQNLSRVFHIVRFFLDGKNAIQKEMSVRLDELSSLIETEMELGDADEYVIVGHSFGAVLASRIAVNLMSSDICKHKTFDLLCMTSIYQLELSSQTHFDAREEVYKKLLLADNINWTEVFNAFDVFCPQRANPCNLNLSVNESDQSGPFFKSVNLRRNLSAGHLKKLRKNLMKVHMQCIFSSDNNETFDYYNLLTGKLPARKYLRS